MQKTIDTPEAVEPIAKPLALTLEQRLEPKLKQAEWLLLLVFALMLWTAGFVDLATHRSRDGIVFGLYSLPYAALLLVYLAGFWAWGRLIFPADSIDLFKRGILAIQKNTWLGIGLFIGASAMLGSMLVWERWASYPLLQGSLLIILLISGLVILLARPQSAAIVQPWRKVLIGGFSVWFGIEAVLQIASLFGALPLASYNGLYMPYGRIYQQAEGLANGRTNKYGWYYPDLTLAPNSRRIMVTGDSFVLGAQVRPDQNVGVALQNLLNSDTARPAVEVLGLGVPGFGPGVYAEPRMVQYSLLPLKPAEVVVYFHLANDLQTATGPGQGVPYYQLQADGSVDAHPDTHAIRHDIWHEVLRGFEPVQPLQTVMSHFLGVQLVSNFIHTQRGEPTIPHIFTLNTDSASPETPFGRSSFAFAPTNTPQAENSLAIAQAQLLGFQKTLAEQGIALRIVTIPYFPAAFYANSGNWDNAVPGYALLRPEQALKQFAAAHNISFLAMGEYLRDTQTPAAEIQSLYLRNGNGHFSVAGHAFFAQATFDCFFAQNAVSSAACSRVTP